MGVKTLFLTDRLYEYMCEVGVSEPEVLRELRAASARDFDGTRQCAPDQARFMSWLVGFMGARRVLELGTFTGCSALAMALALPPDGELITCDIEATGAQLGMQFWRKAGVADTIQFRHAPGMEVLDELLAEGREGDFDFAFLDADKVQHDAYYERTLRLVRAGGVIVFNNVFCRELSATGPEANPALDADGIAYVEAVRELNRKIADDERITITIVPLGDGITLARKR